MEKFNEVPKGEDLVEKIFNSWEEFRSKLEDTLEWSESGGPGVGSSSFMKAVFGEIEVSAEEYRALKRVVHKEVGRIEKEKKDKKEREDKLYSERELEIMSESARRQMMREAKRAGEEPDMDELYPKKRDEDS